MLPSMLMHSYILQSRSSLGSSLLHSLCFGSINVTVFPHTGYPSPTSSMLFTKAGVDVTTDTENDGLTPVSDGGMNFSGTYVGQTSSEGNFAISAEVTLESTYELCAVCLAMDTTATMESTNASTEKDAMAVTFHGRMTKGMTQEGQ